jgi:hypothetical protein
LERPGGRSVTIASAVAVLLVVGGLIRAASDDLDFARAALGL